MRLALEPQITTPTGVTQTSMQQTNLDIYGSDAIPWPRVLTHDIAAARRPLYGSSMASERVHCSIQCGERRAATLGSVRDFAGDCRGRRNQRAERELHAGDSIESGELLTGTR